MTRLLPLIAFLAGCACTPFYSPAAQQQAYQSALADANAQVDGTMVHRVETARANVRKQPGSPREAVVLAKELEASFHAGVFQRGALNAAALVPEATAALEAAAAAQPAEGASLLAVKGTLLIASGSKPEGEAALRASLQKQQTLHALLPLLALIDEGNHREEVVSLCKAARPAMATDDERYELMFASILHAHAASVEGGLAWTTKDDRTFYKQEQAKRDAQADKDNAEWRKKREAESAKLYADMEESRKRSDAQDRCRSQCGSAFHTCKAHCFGNVRCEMDCENAAQACNGGCRY
jgi:hypothetical protein